MILKLLRYLWIDRYLVKILKVSVYGKSNIPKNTNFIVAFNHDGYFDLDFILYAFKSYDVHFFYDIPNDFGKYFLKWWYKGYGLGVSYTLPNKKEINRQALKNATNYLKRGINVGIAPQGPKGEKYLKSIERPFYPGCAIISCKSSKPVIPVRILNDETYIYNDGRDYIKPSEVMKSAIKTLKTNSEKGKFVNVLIGPAIYPNVNDYNKNKEQYVASLTTLIKDSIFNLEEKFKKGGFYA